MTTFYRRVKNHYLYKFGLYKEDWNQSAIAKRSQLKIGEKIDLIHFFNTIYKGRENWCTTFESQTPVTTDLLGRDWELQEIADGEYTISNFSKRALQLCAKDNCIALIALSESAYRIQMEMYKKIHIKDKLRKKLEAKTVKLHPPQKVEISIDEIHKKFLDISEIRFIIVGHDFFRKGGACVIDALYKVREQCKNLRLTIISRLDYKDHASATTKEEYEHYKDIIENEEWIEYYEKLTAEEVIEKVKESHIGLLPSLDETYGYSVLEYQACGCPCVTTDIRALGEINNEQCGWLCHIAPREYGEAIYGCTELYEKKRIRQEITSQLEGIFELILSNIEYLEVKAEKSLERIKTYHSPERYALELERIYRQIR